MHPSTSFVMDEIRRAFAILFEREQQATLIRSRSQEERFVAKDAAPEVPHIRYVLQGWLRAAVTVFDNDRRLVRAKEVALTAPILELWRLYEDATGDEFAASFR